MMQWAAAVGSKPPPTLPVMQLRMGSRSVETIPFAFCFQPHGSPADYPIPIQPVTLMLPTHTIGSVHSWMSMSETWCRTKIYSRRLCYRKSSHFFEALQHLYLHHSAVQTVLFELPVQQASPVTEPRCDLSVSAKQGTLMHQC